MCTYCKYDSNTEYSAMKSLLPIAEHFDCYIYVLYNIKHRLQMCLQISTFSKKIGRWRPVGYIKHQINPSTLTQFTIYNTSTSKLTNIHHGP